MSEGRTPETTWTAQRRLEPQDINLLHDIVLRAQNDPAVKDRPQNALFTAFGEIIEERQASSSQHRTCLNVVFKLLDPKQQGDSLYQKFENILHDEGIQLAFEDDATSQGTHQTIYNDQERSFDGVVSTGMDQFAAEHEQRHLTEAENNEDAGLESPSVSTMMHLAVKRDEERLLVDCLEAWRHRATLARLADRYYEERIKLKALRHLFYHFQGIKDLEDTADQYYAENLKRNALRRVGDEYRVTHIQAMDDERLKGYYLYQWTIRAREMAFTRQQDWKLKQRYLVFLTQSLRDIKHRQNQFENALQHHEQRKDESLMRSFITKLSSKTNELELLNKAADIHYEGRLCEKSFQRWQGTAQTISALNLRAKDAREYFLMRRFITIWYDKAMASRQRRTVLVRWTVVRWRTFAKKRKHVKYEVAYRTVRRHVKMNLARHLLQRWATKSRHLHDMEAAADAQHRTHLLRHIAYPAIENMYDTAVIAQRSEKIADLKAEEVSKRRALLSLAYKAQHMSNLTSTADRFRRLKEETKAAHCLRHMRIRAFELQRRAEDADAFRARRERQTMREFLGLMRAELARRRGAEPPLDLPPATPSQRRALALSRLSTTPAYTPFALRLRGDVMTDDVIIEGRVEGSTSSGLEDDEN